MNKGRKIVITGLIILGLLVLAFIILSNYKNKPINIIESKLNLDLPESSTIERYKYIKDEDRLYTKILIKKQNINDIKSQLDKFFGNEASDEYLKYIPNFINTCPWWDLEKNDIKTLYYKNTTGRKGLFTSVKTRDVWAFVTESNDDYYMYIVH